MYTPAHFRMDDSGQILEFVQAHPFGLLLTNGPEVPEVTHLPLLLQADDSGDDHILGHVAKASPHAKALVDGQAALVVFSGAHGYISPRWYAADGNVPTWNYRSVHATGALRRIADEGELMQLVDALAAEHEAVAASPWQADWSDAKISNMLNAVVGFELKVTHWEGKAKLGQNRSAEDQASLRKNLVESEDSAHQELAGLMSKFGLGNQAKT